MNHICIFCFISRDNKKVAYLLDMKTICVYDLIANTTIAQITHNTKIDWLELNEVAVKLLFRDKKMRYLRIFFICRILIIQVVQFKRD